MFIPDNLILHNFILYEDQEIPLKNMGLVLLKGDNRDEPHKGASGAGKTIIGDAFHWLMSGDTTRKILSNRVIGPFDDNAYVEGNFEINNIKVEAGRYRKHPKYGSSLKIFAGANVSHRKVDNTEERLMNSVGCSFPLLRLSTFYNNDSKYHFSRMDSGMRGKILDEICGTSEANVPVRAKKVNDTIKDLNAEIFSINNNTDSLKLKMENIDQLIKKSNEYINSIDDDTNRMVNDLKSEINTLKDYNIENEKIKLVEWDELIEVNKKKRVNYDLIDKEINICNRNIAVLGTKISILNEDINNINDEINSSLDKDIMCDKCGNIATEKSLKKLNSSKYDLIRDYGIARKELIKLSDKALNYKRALELKLQGLDDTDVSRLINARAKSKNFIDSYYNEIEKIKVKKERLAIVINNKNLHKKEEQNSLKRCKELIVQHKDKINSLFYKLTLLEHQIEYLDILSDFYSPGGFRPLVMRHYSPILSDAANYYLSDFTNGSEEICIDSKTKLASGEIRDKIDIQVLQNGVSKSFPEEFCAGEEGAIDISMNFGIMRLASSRAVKDFGFYFFDEITAGLSQKLVDNLFDLLKNKFVKEGVTVIMTTHRPVNEKYFDKIWVAVKENGRCRIEFER